jgi:hypothetical protein
MNEAVTFSRVKIFLKVVSTVVVPAPDEPVMDMMGCFADIKIRP